ncbi:MAG: LCP family protein [Trueperaceae bacterium]|nr:LCP family protein [Trueperaceae bacterium]MCO5173796.1 LCP family protein [Trueperaceae bacterium]MCW5818992.1 LCP family protein [Trueperaceae bacterium]
MTRRRARLLSLLGILVAVVGLAGYWLTRDVDRKALSDDQRRLIGLEDDEFHASFLIAGRDVVYNGTSTPVYGANGEIVAWNFRGYHGAEGTLTDTILYVDIQGDDISVVAIPRDLWLTAEVARINSMYAWYGAQGLLEHVEAILGVPIDYYVIIKLDIFQNLVDALGGVVVDVPYRMDYDDNAGNLHIHFAAGPRLMSGEDAAKFVRFRHSLRGDIDRIDNVKRLAYALLQKVKDLNVRAVTKVPELMDTFFSDVETNATITIARELVQRVGGLVLANTATLPNYEKEDGVPGVVYYDPAAVNAFMAATFGGEARTFKEAPDATLLVTDSSGQPGALDWYVDHLLALGVPEANIITRTGSAGDQSPTRLLATLASWEDADYYADMLNVGKQQIDRFSPVQRRSVQLELVLGADAISRTSVRTDSTVASGDAGE